MFRRKTVAGAAFACTALLLVGCGDSTPEATEPSATVEAPESLAVHRPGAIDTDISPDEVPDWPGPAPADFLEPDPPSGERGELTGEDAELVHDDAADYPESVLQDGEQPGERTQALWSVDGTVEWLVVEPQ